MMMLEFDWTLDDLSGFAHHLPLLAFWVLIQRLTLVAFDVTITTYHHLLLTTKDDVCKDPTLISPLFVHVKKNFQAYHFWYLLWLAENQNL